MYSRLTASSFALTCTELSAGCVEVEEGEILELRTCPDLDEVLEDTRQFIPLGDCLNFDVPDGELRGGHFLLQFREAAVKSGFLLVELLFGSVFRLTNARLGLLLDAQCIHGGIDSVVAYPSLELIELCAQFSSLLLETLSVPLRVEDGHLRSSLRWRRGLGRRGRHLPSVDCGLLRP